VKCAIKEPIIIFILLLLLLLIVSFEVASLPAFFFVWNGMPEYGLPVKGKPHTQATHSAEKRDLSTLLVTVREGS
jgi:hypothetical protein